MKKTTRNLSLQKTTIRLLQGAELTEVAGGGPTANCTQVETVCSGTGDTQLLSHHNYPGHHGCHSGQGHGCQ
jgi:hypothetical protein